jgi:RNA polymerase sigma factor (sigma-70 family)
MEPSLEQAAVDVPAETPLELADLVTLNQALVELEAIDDRAARVVELRFFAGMSHDEAAAALGIGRATVARRWRFARAWLRNRLENAPRAPTS